MVICFNREQSSQVRIASCWLLYTKIPISLSLRTGWVSVELLPLRIFGVASSMDAAAAAKRLSISETYNFMMLKVGFFGMCWFSLYEQIFWTERGGESNLSLHGLWVRVYFQLGARAVQQDVNRFNRHVEVLCGFEWLNRFTDPSHRYLSQFLRVEVCRTDEFQAMEYCTPQFLLITFSKIIFHVCVQR